MAPFSSRGMTTWELPSGYGRMKPDLVSYGKNIIGPRIGGGCRFLSGTSVASPVVAGVVVLLASVRLDHYARSSDEGAPVPIINPASMKQVLAETANPVPDAHLYEQGVGNVNLNAAFGLLKQYVPHASVLPPRIDLTLKPCKYFWPHCTQPLYFGAMPHMFNLTVLNGMSVSGRVWAPPMSRPGDKGASDQLYAPHFIPDDEASRIVDIGFEYPEFLWPWSGYMGLLITLTRNVKGRCELGGTVVFTVVTDDEARSSEVRLPLRFVAIPTPRREKRVLWDQFHNMRYPTAYFPRDNLDTRQDVLDWNGDHPHTNFKDTYDLLVAKGYYVEVLGYDFTCFDATQYGALLIVDPEEEFFPEEIAKLQRDVDERGLSVVIFAEWYNIATMKRLRFFDENTNLWWMPKTGGSNVPALNELLAGHGIALSDKVYKGMLTLPISPHTGTRIGSSLSTQLASSTSIMRFPAGGYVVEAFLRSATAGSMTSQNVAVLGLVDKSDVRLMAGKPALADSNAGRIAVFVDASCLDMNHRSMPDCRWVMLAALEFAMKGTLDARVFPEGSITQRTKPFVSADAGPLPERMPDSDLNRFSKVKQAGAQPVCLNKPASFRPYYARLRDYSPPGGAEAAQNTVVSSSNVVSGRDGGDTIDSVFVHEHRERNDMEVMSDHQVVHSHSSHSSPAWWQYIAVAFGFFILFYLCYISLLPQSTLSLSSFYQKPQYQGASKV